MNKAFYIVGIVFAVIFLFLGAYYSEEVSSAKWNNFFNDYSYDYSSYDYSYSYSDSNLDDEYTVEAGLWSVFFFLSFTAIVLLGLIKVKTATNKVLSIIGLSLTGIFLIWNFIMISAPGSISFDEVYPGWVMYCNIMLAFSIVGLVQSIRFEKRNKIVGNPAMTSERKDLLDS